MYKVLIFKFEEEFITCKSSLWSKIKDSNYKKCPSALYFFFLFCGVTIKNGLVSSKHCSIVKKKKIHMCLIQTFVEINIKKNPQYRN